jgi:hypothetical protein
MKEKIDLIITQTISKLEKELSETKQKAFSQKHVEDLFTQYFTEALEEANNDVMQAVLWKRLSAKFHPDKLENETFKFKNYLQEQGFSNIPQQVLNSLNLLTVERPPKFLENSSGWVTFFGQLIWKIEELQEGCAERKKYERQLRKQSFILSALHSMWHGLDSYFQPVRFLFKTIFWLVFIPCQVAIVLLLISLILAGLILSLPKKLINFLISIVTNNEFSRQVELYKTSYKEKKLEEMRKSLPEEVASALFDKERQKTPIMQFFGIDIERALDEEAIQKLHSSSILYLKLVLLGFYHSLFKDISGESVGNQILFVISWPFRFILDIILFAFATVIELARLIVGVVLLLAGVVDAMVNTTLLFLLNVPRYVFFEIPRAIIHGFQPSNNANMKEDNREDPVLLIEGNPDKAEDAKKIGDFHPSVTPGVQNNTEGQVKVINNNSLIKGIENN